MKYKGGLSCFVCTMLIAAAFVSFGSSSNVNADWAQVSHDESHQAFTSEVVDAHELKWTIELRETNKSDVTSSPIIYKGKVIVATVHSLYVLDLKTGDEIWNFTSEDTIFDTPAVAEDIIVVPTWAGNTYGISIEGKHLWELPIVSSIPAIHEGRAYLSGLAAVYCINIKNGDEIWKYEIAHPGTPSIWNEKVIFGSHDNGTLYAIHKETASLLWSYPIQDDGIRGAPVIAEERVFFSTFHWVDHDSIAGRLTALDISGSFLWDFHLDDSIPGAPSVAYGKVFFGTVDWTDNKRDDLEIFALNSADGSIEWTLKGYETKATFAISDHKVYFPVEKANDETFLYVCHEYSGTQFWKYDCETNPGSVSASSSPSIADGTLVVGGIGGDVIAIGSSLENDGNDGSWISLEKGFIIFIAILLAIGVLYFVTKRIQDRKK